MRGKFWCNFCSKKTHRHIIFCVQNARLPKKGKQFETMRVCTNMRRPYLYGLTAQSISTTLLGKIKAISSFLSKHKPSKHIFVGFTFRQRRYVDGF